MIQFEIDKSRNDPLYLQIVKAIEAAILTRELSPGCQLPATRKLAERLGVHRNTVIAAYRYLVTAGSVRTGVGAGTFITDKSVPAGIPTPTGAATQRSEETGTIPFSWQRLLSNTTAADPDLLISAVLRGITIPEDLILLSGAVPDRRQFPMDEFTTCVRKILSGADPTMLEYGSPEGYEPLREWLADWLRSAGVKGVDLQRIFIVSGSQQGLDLLARLFLRSGDQVVLEEPTYTGAFMVLGQTGARMIGVPVDEEGISVAELEKILDREPVKFLYTMPAYQNPTGICLSARRREELLRLSRRRQLAIVEDHYDTPLFYQGEQPRFLLADEPNSNVIHLGTFSKILFPGLRLGWMILPAELCEPLRQLKRATDLSTGMLTQRVMAEFCRSGNLAKHLTRLRRVNSGRLQEMLGALDDHFPVEANWTRPTGGMTLWVELPGSIDILELYRSAASRGVLFTPGTAFYPNRDGGRNAMRLSFNRESRERIRNGVRLLGELIKEQTGSHTDEISTHGDAVPFL